MLSLFDRGHYVPLGHWLVILERKQEHPIIKPIFKVAPQFVQLLALYALCTGHNTVC